MSAFLVAGAVVSGLLAVYLVVAMLVPGRLS